MTELIITVTIKDGSRKKKVAQTKTFDLDVLRQTPNPRQALVAHFLYHTREVLADVTPPLNL